MDHLASFILRQDVPGLDYQKIEFLNKEIQNITMLDLPFNKKYVDKYVKIPFTAVPKDFINLHVEFQTRADQAFAERTGRYHICLTVNNSHRVISFAVVHRAARNYRHRYQFGTADSGALVRYKGLVIKEMAEADFKDTKCVITLVLYSIWLFEHKSRFPAEVLAEKFLKTAKHVLALGFTSFKHYSALLFIQKNAFKCLSDSALFGKFAEEIRLSDHKNHHMTIIDAILFTSKEEGLKEGEEKGVKKGKEIGLKEGEEKGVLLVAKNLLKAAKLSIKEIAACTGLKISALRKMAAAL